MKKMRIIHLVFISILLLTNITGEIKAQEVDSIQHPVQFHINLDKETIQKGFTVSAFAEKLKLSLIPGILSESTDVDMQELNEEFPLPWKLDKISGIYQFEFKNKAAYDNHKPFYIQFSYEPGNNDYKQVFFYDKNYQAWRPLPTRDFPDSDFVRSLIHLPYARIAVFSFPGVLTAGRASWYSYKPGNFSASPDFPSGSRLRVYNRANGKFVDVEINDYGPVRKLHPDRVIDLEKNAFKRIANLSDGVVDIYVEPLFVAPLSAGNIMEINDRGIGPVPNISLASAVIMNEASGNILWSKDSGSILPIASLTKLIAIKVFLDIAPDIERTVVYKKADEEHNYAYAKEWELAKLKVLEGDSMQVKDLLYSALTGSANNAVESLVRISGLDRGQFIARMNKSVELWGASSTHFIEPTGLSPENVSSSLDYAIITREVLKNPIIVKASTVSAYEFTTINTKKYHKIKNTNQIIRFDKYAITGSKTGYLEEAGYCLMTRIAAENKENIIVVTLNAANREQSFAETEKLIQFGLKINKE